ncbi:MAG: TonB-dependent receptor [Ferruginibacter sp.]|nr:TonB-dependent receptor [Ferruginibacter sp.]
MFTKRLLQTIFCFVCLYCSQSSFAQSRVITGTITDEKNTPLEGVSVLNKQTGIGTQSNSSGVFILNVPATANSVVVSMVGFLTSEVAVPAASAKISIRLRRGNETMDSLVVVGYGTQRRKDVTGSISSLSGAAIKNLPVTNVADALQGRVSGVEVIKNSGEPGAPSQITIRGLSSLNQPAPLYVIDGVQSSGDNLNVQDIATIDVLKDASAASIYGSSAAGGVIIITTKRGQGAKPSINFNARYGITTPRVQDLLNKDDFVKIKKLTLDNYYSNNTRVDTLPNTNWVDAIFRDGTEKNYNLSVSGATSNVNYFLSGNYNDQKGVYLDNKSNITGARINTDIKLSNRIKIGEQVNFWQRSTDPVGTPTINPPVRTVPTMAVYSATGFGTNPPGFNGANLVAQITSADRNNKQLNFQGNVYGEVKLPLSLTFRTTFGYTYYGEEGNYFQNTFRASVAQVTAKSLSKSIVSNRSILNAYTLAFDRTISKNHNINALVGYEQYKNLYNALYTDETDVGGNNYAYIATSGSVINIRNGGYDPFGLVKSLFGRVNYDYRKKYFVAASLRRDANFTVFGPGNQQGYFPGGSVGWRISEEPFFKNSFPIVNALKFRGSYGELGNSRIGAYRFLSTYDAINAQNFTQGGAAILNYTQNSLANSDVKWETVKETNIGVDGEAFNGHFFFSVDWYNKKTIDMLYDLPIPLSVGISRPFTTNIGSMQSRGVDLLVGYKNSTKDFNYSVTLTGTFNKNKVLDLDGTNANPIKAGDNNYGNATFGAMVNQPITYTIAGAPFGQFYGYKVEGIYASQAEIDKHPQDPDATKKANIGDLIYADVNGDGKITDADRTVIGNPYPKVAYGASINLNWRGFDLAMLWNGVAGVDIFNGVRPYTENLWSDGNTTAAVFGASNLNGNGITSQPIIGVFGTNGTTFRPDPNGNYSKVSSYFVENGSYLKLKNLQLGYNFSGRSLERIKITNARVFVMANNVFTITKYKGLDPELGSQNVLLNGGSTTRGIDAPYKYPAARIYSFGVDLSF